MADLSPAAREILIAYWEAEEVSQQNGVAAALRAAADQMSSHQSQKFLYSIADAMKLQDIATELEQS